MYFDNAATTPLLPEVKEEIIRYLDYYGNPSSQYQEGFLTRQKIEEVRDQVAEIFCCNSRKIIFTCSGSASNNLVIRGLDDNYIYFYTPTSHKSMYLACKSKTYNQEIKVNKDGIIDIENLKNQLEEQSLSKKVVLCYEMANSELGIYQNAKEIAELVHSYSGLVVADLTAFMPHLPLTNPCELADFYTFSAHKLGALKGVGVVCLNCYEQLSPLIYGAQEQGLFGGTENVIGIISLGTALKSLNIKNHNRFDKMANYFQELIKKNIKDCYVISEKCPYKIPQIMTICFRNVSGEELVHMMDKIGYSISTGSACNSGNLEPSYTLRAIDVCKDDIPCCVRISFTGEETLDEIVDLAEKLKEQVNILRTLI